MAFGHGSNAYLKVGDNDISDYVESSDLNFDRDSADIKTFGASFVQRVMGIISAAISAAAAYDPTLDGYIWTALTASTATTWEFGPQGSGSGSVKYSGSMWISTSKINAGSGDKVTHNFTCLPTGTITKGTF